MKLVNIGGATAMLKHGSQRMLFDPWMNEGDLDGAWAPLAASEGRTLLRNYKTPHHLQLGGNGRPC